MQDSYIGNTTASQAVKAGSTPVSCSKKRPPAGRSFLFGAGYERSRKADRSEAKAPNSPVDCWVGRGRLHADTGAAGTAVDGSASNDGRGRPQGGLFFWEQGMKVKEAA